MIIDLCTIHDTGTSTSGSSLWMAVVFSWNAVAGATAYSLQIGTAAGASDYGTFGVGNVLTFTVHLPPGTYFSRVLDNFTNLTSAEVGPTYV